jgi:hypothetical protein
MIERCIEPASLKRLPDLDFFAPIPPLFVTFVKNALWGRLRLALLSSRFAFFTPS